MRHDEAWCYIDIPSTFICIIMNHPDPLEAALAALLGRIARGQEFPDASASVALRHGVFIDELTEAYDDHCANTSTRGALLAML